MLGGRAPVAAPAHAHGDLPARARRHVAEHGGRAAALDPRLARPHPHRRVPVRQVGVPAGGAEPRREQPHRRALAPVVRCLEYPRYDGSGGAAGVGAEGEC